MTSRANSSRRSARSALSLHGRAADTTAKMRQFIRPLPRALTRPVSVAILLAWVAVMAPADQPLVPPGLVGDAGDRSRAVRIGRGLARRLLPRREDRIHGQPDPEERRRLRARRRRPAADVAARRDDPRDDPHDRARRQGLSAALVRVLARSRNRPDRSPRTGERHAPRARRDNRRQDADGSARPAGAAGAVAESLAPPGERRPGDRRAASLDHLRPRHAAQRAVVVDVGKRELVRGAGDGADSGVSRRDGVRRAADDVVGHRHGRSRARGKPARPPHGPRIGGERAGHGRAEPGAGRPARGGGDRAGRPGTHRRAARRPAAPDAARRRRSLGNWISTAAARRWPATSSSCAIRRACGPAAADPDAAPVSRAGTAHRKRRAGDPRRGREGRARRRHRRAIAPSGSRATSTACSRRSRRSAFRRRARCCAPRSATATSTRRSTSRWRARSGFPRASPSASCSCAARSITTRGPRCTSTRAAAGLWLPVDPTLNQFPADATHVRLARGGLDKQTAILPLVGRLKMTVLDLEVAPERRADPGRRARRTSASSPSRFRSARRAARAHDDCHPRSGQDVRPVHGRRRRQPRREAGRDPRLPRVRTAPARRRRCA